MGEKLYYIPVVDNVLLGLRLELSVHEQLQLVTFISLIISKADHFAS